MDQTTSFPIILFFINEIKEIPPITEKGFLLRIELTVFDEIIKKNSLFYHSEFTIGYMRVILFSYK